MPDRAPIPTTVWLRPEQAGLVRAVADAAGLKLMAVGCSEKGRAGALASDLGAPLADDLRAALASAESGLIWIASADGFGPDQSGQDAAAMAAAQARGVHLATLEPIPSAALDLATGGWTKSLSGARPIDGLRFCPLARSAPAFRVALEMLETFGRPRTLAVESLCRSEHGTLAAPLFNAFELIAALFGEPDAIDASFVSSSAATGIHALPGQTLRGLHGSITANLRFADGRNCCLLASNQAGIWRRSATLLGEGGRLHIDDAGFVWTDAQGTPLDEHTETPSHPDPAVASISQSLKHLLDPAAPAQPPIDHETVLALAQTALLSCRTGQTESPAMIRRMIAIS